MKLKRARLADDLNEKIALRPGPLELVEKNIIPVDSSVKEAIKGRAGDPLALCAWHWARRGCEDGTTVTAESQQPALKCCIYCLQLVIFTVQHSLACLARTVKKELFY